LPWRLTTTIPFTLAFSFLYAIFERYEDPCGFLPWCGYKWDGLAMYQYAFMLPLFTFIALLPVLKDIPMNGGANLQAFGTFLLAVLGEDTLFFAIEERGIQPGLYTTQWGYIMIQGFAVPYWYFFFAFGICTSFYLSKKWPTLEDRLKLSLRNYWYMNNAKLDLQLVREQRSFEHDRQ
jgi:hypothetical protein